MDNRELSETRQHLAFLTHHCVKRRWKPMNLPQDIFRNDKLAVEATMEVSLDGCLCMLLID